MIPEDIQKAARPESNLIAVRTADLVGPALDWAVAKAQGWQMIRVPTDIDGNYGGEVLAPPGLSSDFKFPQRGAAGSGFFLRRWSADWDQGGPLIEKYNISLHCPQSAGDVWAAWITTAGGDLAQAGDTALQAACRAIVATKIGLLVQVPAELMP